MATDQFSVPLRSPSDTSFYEKDKDSFGIDDVEMTKRLSRLFSFTAKESFSPSVVVTEVEAEVGRKRSRQLPQILSSMKEEESGSDSHHESIVPKAKEITKRTHRFSSLFVGTSANSIDEEFSVSGGGDQSKESPRREDIANMVFKLFHVRSSRHGSKHKRNISTRSAASFKPRQPLKRERKPLTIKLFSRQQKQDLPVTKVTSNVDTLKPTVVARSTKSTRHRSTSVCDSKFSSISSALSYISLPHEPIAITAQQCAILLHLLRKVARSLLTQEQLTSSFSTNLAHLFARKEKAIDGNKRLGKEVRKLLIEMMSGLRELVGRTFLKKAVFQHRSLQLCHDMEDMLASGYDVETEDGGFEINESETTLDDSPSFLDSVMAVTSSEVSTSTTSLPPLDHQVDIHNFRHALHLISEDIDIQRQLDQALRGGIVGPCEDIRFPATFNERLAMRRFVAFVDGSMRHLEKRYIQEGRVVKVLACLGSVLKDGCT